METYQPFLLPLLRQPRRHPDEWDGITSPIREEARIRQVPHGQDSLWVDLAVAVQRNWGLPLLLEAPDQAVPHRLSGPCAEARTLILKGPKGAWFLMEHPAAIEQFDRLAEPGQLPALARPSLFAELWRQSDTGMRIEEDGTPAVHRAGDSAAQALSYHLDQLTAQGQPSDWHLEPRRDHYLSRLRIHGILTRAERIPLARARWLIDSLATQAGCNDAPADRPRDSRTQHRTRDGGLILLRLSLIPSLYGPALTVRFLYPQSGQRHSITELVHCPGENPFEHLLETREGLCLLVGPTGSGKTTTLHALLRAAVQRDEKVLAIEDPVEVTLPGVHHLNVDSPPGLSYARALRAFLRQAPDCVLIGEIRDEETAALALQAARTGHRILSTLHARDNPGLVRRFADLGQPLETLQSLDPMVVHQRLLPRLCPHCRQLRRLADSPDDPIAQAITRLCLPLPASHAVAVGCARCQCGIDGRVAVISSGSWLPETDVSIELLQAAWPMFSAGRIPLAGLIPLLVPCSGGGFPVCHETRIC
jgi:type IV pilus assembly protein PilB